MSKRCPLALLLEKRPSVQRSGCALASHPGRNAFSALTGVSLHPLAARVAMQEAHTSSDGCPESSGRVPDTSNQALMAPSPSLPTVSNCGKATLLRASD
jgi:hypothetical protein